MRINRADHYDDSAAVIFATLTSKAFQERKCEDAGAISFEITVVERDGQPVVISERKLPTVGLPTLVRKLVPSGVTSTETITWRAAEADGSRTASVSVDLHGAPANLDGTISVVAHDPNSCSVVVDLDLRVPLAVVGGRVEKLAAPFIVTVGDAEEKSAKAWIAEGKASAV